MTETALLILILLLGFALRCLSMTGATSDLYWHLWQIEKSARFGFGRHDVFNSVVDARLGYPSLGHLLISFLPGKRRLVLAPFLSIASDCIGILLVYVLTWALARRLGIESAGRVFSAPAAAAMLFATSPILLPVTARMKTFGGRPLGMLLATFYLFFLHLAFVDGHGAAYAACVVLGLLVIMTSQFAWQVLVYFSVLLSLFYLSLVPAAAFGLTMAIGWALKPLGVRDNLRNSLNHMRWYADSQKHHTTATGRNSLRDIRDLPAHLVRKPLTFFQICLQKNSFIIALYGLPFLPLMAAWALRDIPFARHMLSDPAVRYLVAVSAASLFMFLLSSFPPFLSLGQAERYFEYSCGALCMLFALYASARGVPERWVLIVLLLQLAGVLVNLLWNARDELIAGAQAQDRETEGLIGHLAASEGRKILTIPTKLAFLLSACGKLDSHRFYYHFLTGDRIDGHARMREDEAVYNLPRPDLEHFRNRYGIDTVVADKRTLRSAGKEGVVYALDHLPRLYEDELYAVYGLPGPAAAAGSPS